MTSTTPTQASPTVGRRELNDKLAYLYKLDPRQVYRLKCQATRGIVLAGSPSEVWAEQLHTYTPEAADAIEHLADLQLGTASTRIYSGRKEIEFQIIADLRDGRRWSVICTHLPYKIVAAPAGHDHDERVRIRVIPAANITEAEQIFLDLETADRDAILAYRPAAGDDAGSQEKP